MCGGPQEQADVHGKVREAFNDEREKQEDWKKYHQEATSDQEE